MTRERPRKSRPHQDPHQAEPSQFFRVQVRGPGLRLDLTADARTDASGGPLSWLGAAATSVVRELVRSAEDAAYASGVLEGAGVRSSPRAPRAAPATDATDAASPETSCGDASDEETRRSAARLCETATDEQLAVWAEEVERARTQRRSAS